MADPRSYVVLLELTGTRPGMPRFDLQLVEAYDVYEACKSMAIETFGRYKCENAQIVFARPGTLHNVKLAARLMEDLPLLRMVPVGRVA
jgi:hypothetical protein